MLPRQQFNNNNLDFRKRQIDTLKVFNHNVVEVTENEEYCLHFESGGRNFVLTVWLPSQFPKERPNLQISPVVQHQWVNSASGDIESAPGLLNYTPHSDLGRVVQAIIREFERCPPVVINSTTGGGGGGGVGGVGGCIPAVSPINIPKTTSSNTGSQAMSQSTQQQQQQQQTQIVTAKSLDSGKDDSPLSTMDAAKISNKLNDSSLPNLSTLSLDELKQLDTDPEFFDDFIEEMSVVQHLNEELDSMINQVEIISRENESKETHLVELKRKLSDDVTALKHLGEKCDQLNKKYLKKSEDYAPQHIRELLKMAASNADTECDSHVEQFLNGKIDVQTFLNNYTLSKKISSERKAKEERLGHQLSALERAGI